MAPRVGMNDAVLVEECAELGDFLASYEAGCRLLAEAECGPAGETAVEEARLRLLDAGRQWRASLRRVTRRPARGVAGLVAKARALQSNLAQCSAEDTEAMALTLSLIADLLRILAGDA